MLRYVFWKHWDCFVFDFRPNLYPRLIRTLNTRLSLVLFSVGIVPLIMSGFLVNQYLRLPYLHESIWREQLHTQTLALEIGDKFKHTLLMTGSLATYVGQHKSSDCLRTEQFLQDWLALNRQLSQIQLLNLDGEPITTLSLEDGDGHSFLPSSSEIGQLINDRITLTKFVQNELQHEYDLYILEPIENEAGELTHLLQVIIPLKWFAPMSGLNGEHMNKHVFGFADLDGLVVQSLGGSFRTLVNGVPFSAALQEMPSPDQITSYVIEDGQFRSGRLITASYIDGLNLILMVDRPLHEELQLGVTLGINTLGLILALGMAGVLIMMMTRSLLSPITRLAEAAEGLTAGDAAIPLPDGDEHDEEIADLIRAFDQMRTAVNERDYELRQISAQLEDRVEKRTAALIKINRRLEQEVVHHAQTAAKLREARDEAERANQAKSTFLVSMSHELRTPLSSILGYGDLLRELSSTQTPVTRQFLEKINGAASHLLEIINDILDLAKIEAGRIEVFESQFVVTTLIEDVVDIARPLVENQNNTLDIVLDDGHGFMVSDEIKVRQVLLNLLSNAAKFTDNGQIILQVLRDTDDDGQPYICFSVTDTGIGMNQAQLDRLFQPFTQVHNGNKYYRGTGLGLSLSFHFCQLLGGTLTVTSTPDVGSTFTACLPQDKKAA